MQKRLKEIEELNEKREVRRVKENKLKALGDIQGLIRDHKMKLNSTQNSVMREMQPPSYPQSPSKFK